MSSVKRNTFISFLFLSILLTAYVWYGEFYMSKLSIFTTIHSHVYAGTQNSPKNSLNIKEKGLHELHELKRDLGNLMRTYSRDHQQNNDSTFSNHQLINPTSQHATLALMTETSTIQEVEITRHNVGTPHSTIILREKSKATEREHAIMGNNTKSIETADSVMKNETDSNFMVSFHLLQALMNGTGGSNVIQSLPQGEYLIAQPGCTLTGDYSAEESKNSWLKFKHTLEKYTTFHREQLKELKAGNSSVRTLTWSCHNPVKCAGIGDQFYRIQQALVFSIAFSRVLTLHWNPAGYETMKYLQPNKIDWTYFNNNQGMHEYHEPELEKIKVMDTAKEFEPLYELLASKSRTHVTVNHELQVPFLRGMSKAIRTNAGLRTALKQIGFADLIADKKHHVPVNFLSGELLRYLFHFRKNVVKKVNTIQQQLGLTDRPYLALHIRTGFLGMKQEESGTFNSEKIYRNPSDWDKSLTCSVRLAGWLHGPEAPIFLATDSSRVKELALEKYGERFVMVNVTLQHVAFTDVKSTQSVPQERQTIRGSRDSTLATGTIVNIDGIDGYMATWIEFLLLARASAMVHSISGFSSTAAQFCSMHNQYHVSNCKA